MANWWPRLGALLVILVSACLLPVSSAAQTPTTPPTRAVSAAPAALLMVMDLSGSMNDNDANGKNKLTGAKPRCTDPLERGGAGLIVAG
ncbi:hypothetical protein J6397_32305 [Rhodococcus qingshengii]|uniref:hypothetical protein n=1 Tax=Rhodococcus qingshengii TaxID=334542 RepID=UPI001AE8403E|nr:hypothetical protein [Rhodococcus qingshengii]MBP1054807.1 hypothetical protein [Rhodococcus qingshengii]